MWRRTLDSWGYSPLKQINTDERAAAAARVGARTRTGAAGRHARSCTTAFCTSPILATSSRPSMRPRVTSSGNTAALLPADIEKYINAPFINRNIAIHGNLIIDTSADGYLYALDARTGKEVWNTLVSDYKTAIHQTSGPIVADGKVFSGRGCDPLPNSNPEPCVVVAHDAETGRELWRTRTIPAPGERGNETWGDIPLRRAQARGHVDAAELRPGTEAS